MVCVHITGHNGVGVWEVIVGEELLNGVLLSVKEPFVVDVED